MNVKHAMILAAGLGTRMKPLTLETPKPLIKVGSKNLLERSINLLENHGVEQIIINVHYLADKIERSFNTPLPSVFSPIKNIRRAKSGISNSFFFPSKRGK